MQVRLIRGREVKVYARNFSHQWLYEDGKD
jgi:hypothetical protein